MAKIEEAISKLSKHANVSGATPTDVAGQAAYTARVSPKEGGSLIGGAELSWDAVHGVPLRAALYSSTSSSPVIELAATEISYGPVADSVFDFTPPPSAKVEEVTLPQRQGAKHTGSASAGSTTHPNVTTRGHGVSGVAVIESKTKPGEKPPNCPKDCRRSKSTAPPPPSCRPPSERCSASSARACATCSSARSHRRPSRQSRGACRCAAGRR